jgi:ATP-dependent 26S proteasome regulatory subunit
LRRDVARPEKEGELDTSYGSYDARWIEDGLLKRKSNYSPIVCFETGDPKRLLQLKAHLLDHPDFGQATRIWVYDQWDGLGRLVRKGEGGAAEISFDPYLKEAGSSALAKKLGGEAGRVGDFRAALREVDLRLKQARSVFIIQNITDNREHDTGLLSALKAWAIDPQIIASGSVVFIVTSAAERVLDEFTRDLVVIISVDPSSRLERERLIHDIARDLEVTVTGEEIAALVIATAGLNLHQLESVLAETYFTGKRFSVGVIKTLKSALVKKSGVLEVTDPHSTFDDIGGYQVIKDFVRRCIINVLSRPDRARRLGVPLPRGLLLFGPPGTGKSLFANALASEINLPFINFVTENIYSKWLGESGQNMKNAIRLAEKMSPAVVFVDEIDRFGRRGPAADSAGEETRRVFSQFLEWLGRSDREAIIVGTTNVPGHLDEAFTRTGRFDYKIPFLYPGPSARLDVMRVHLGLMGHAGGEMPGAGEASGGGRRARCPLAVSEEEMLGYLRGTVVPRTASFSGAELEEVVTRAKRSAFDRGADAVAPADFDQAVGGFRIDTRHREKIIQEYLDEARRLTDDQTFLDAIQTEMGTTGE